MKGILMMSTSFTQRIKKSRFVSGLAAAGVAALILSGCSAAAPEAPEAPAAGGSDSEAVQETVAVSLILKNLTNPFFVAMEAGARAKAAEVGVELTVGAGKEEGDDQGQIDLIEAAIAQGQAGILIVPMSTNVNAAITKAREAGLFVIALDTPTEPADVVSSTFATDNCLAGEAIGQWAAGKLDGQKAVIAQLVIFDDRVVPVDFCRANGFLMGMGIDVPVLEEMDSAATSGSYTTGAGGDYEIACLEATGASEEGGRSGMERCLAANPDINVVYTINEPTAFGANVALEAAGKVIGEDVFVVSVDGGLAGVEAVKAGQIQATSQQYPLRMASFGVQAIYDIATGGAAPANTSANGKFFDTGVALCTDDPQDAVVSAVQETADYCIENAWG
jgi:fructose transport system substrate-binding protein